jgi:hypothetical protein
MDMDELDELQVDPSLVGWPAADAGTSLQSSMSVLGSFCGFPVSGASGGSVGGPPPASQMRAPLAALHDNAPAQRHRPHGSGGIGFEGSTAFKATQPNSQPGLMRPPPPRQPPAGSAGTGTAPPLWPSQTQLQAQQQQQQQQKQQEGGPFGTLPGHHGSPTEQGAPQPNAVGPPPSSIAAQLRPGPFPRVSRA